MTLIKRSDDKRFDFEFDLHEGQEREVALIAVFGQASRVEVKSMPRAASIYGTVFIEFQSRGQPSGLRTTKATHWAIETHPDRWVILPIKDLRSLCRRAFEEGGYVLGGDRDVNGIGTSAGFLIPVEWLLGKG